LNGKAIRTLEFDKIIGLLTERASTVAGKVLAAGLLPASGLDEVNRRLTETNEAADVIRLKGAPPFGGIRSIGPLLRRAAIGGMLEASELMDIASTAGAGRRLKRFLAAVHKDHPLPLLAELFEPIAELNELEDAIWQCIDEQGEVLDRASAELARIRREKQLGEGRVKEKLEQMIRSSTVRNMLQDAIVTMRGGRYVIPVKQEYRSRFGGIVHDQSASGATLFIEPEAVVQLNNRLRQLALDERREIERILHMLTAKVAGHIEELGDNLDRLARIDFLFAKALLAADMKASRPDVNDRGFIRLRKARHPLLGDKAVPLDVELGGAFRTIVITGPNTGGKTVSLKTIGLLTLMAASGLFVPAEEGSECAVFDAVYADIGDEQSIEQNLSTFSSHLTNIISILQRLTPSSLVLLDELGAGTDPSEGSALAIAILDHIHRQGCRTVATTHYSELKAYAYDREGMINASMEFDIATLTPTYRLLVGVPGRSNAFAIARRLGLPERIISHAEGQIGEEDKRIESMIASLEENRIGAEAERRNAEQLRRELEETKRKLDEERERFARQKEELLARAAQEAQEAVAKARREAEAIIADLRRMALEEGGSVKEHRLIEARKRLDETVPDLAGGVRDGHAPAAKPARVEPGDEVFVRSLNRTGFVVETGEAEATVQLGILKMKLSLTDLQPVERKAETPKMKASGGAGIRRTRDERLPLELDLRGKTLEESYVEVDRFLDEAFLAGVGQAHIIHGKGTGVLRAGIQQFLRKHKHVKSFRLGQYGEGGAGVTVVEFK
jgi:DNA mismatch repair protein MutS2